MGDGVDYKFGDAPGLPAVEHAKKRIQERKAKEKAEKKLKEGKYRKTFYTVSKGKIIMLTVKPSGLYRSYFDSMKKMGPDLFKSKLKKWREAGQWLEEFAVEETVHDLINKMQDDMAKEK